MYALLLAALIAAPQDTSVGVTSLRAASATSPDTVTALVWYPTRDAPRDTTLGLLPVRVAAGAAILPSAGRYPIVLISHGTSGSETGHLDLALALVRTGFVVLSVRHPGDNVFEHQALGTDAQFYGRSHHVVQALDQLLADPRWGPQLDARRIGFVGFSSGGYTGMTLLGARPDFRRLATYCRRHPGDENYCADGLRGHVTLTGRYSAPRPEPRIGAAVLMAPAISFLLDSASLARVRTPILLVRAERDDIVLEPDNVTRMRRMLPSAESARTIAGAGHYVFLAPCSPALAARAAFICTDPPGVDRSAVHATLNQQVVAFLRRRLL